MIRRILSALLAPTVAEELAAIREQIGDLDSARAELDDVRNALLPWRKDAQGLVEAVRDLVKERENYAKAVNDLDGMIRARDTEVDRLRVEPQRTAAEERADVLAMLDGQIRYAREKGSLQSEAAYAHARVRIENGEHIGAAKKCANEATPTVEAKPAPCHCGGKMCKRPHWSGPACSCHCEQCVDAERHGVLVHTTK